MLHNWPWISRWRVAVRDRHRGPAEALVTAARSEADAIPDTSRTTRSVTSGVASLSLLAAGLAAVALGALVFATDPEPREERLFVLLLLVLAAGLSTSAMLLLGRRTDSAVADTLRACRRGLLFGLACSGAVVLQLNAALSAPNVGFLLLLLLIVEMIFLARRQNPA